MKSILIAFLLLLVAPGCGPADADASDEAASTDEPVSYPFIRSDQVNYGRAPFNTKDLHTIVPDDFSNPVDTASKVIGALKLRPTKNPIYLGNIHTWLYNASSAYRANVETLASRIYDATHHRILFYFEEENASHPPRHVDASHASDLRQLTKSAYLLVATYVDGQQKHTDVQATVQGFKNYYHSVLGVPMSAMLIDIDLSQTPTTAYYGTRGNLANFNQVVGWALLATYNRGFGGFHTMGNGPNACCGTAQAADSTYDALNADWDALVAAHPKREFVGL